ncbi:MAG: DUF1338 family protein [Bdellovibrionales bacterium]|nr:DUF1338 family protein [Bdellovibrionales bacterium]
MIDPLQSVREKIFNHFWSAYRAFRPEVQKLEIDLNRRGKKWIHDHHAFLDLTGPFSGISNLKQIFENLGYVHQGSGYIPEKQNIFSWLAPLNNISATPTDSSSQLVLADFDLTKCSRLLRMTIEKYTDQATPAPHSEIQKLLELIKSGKTQHQETLASVVINYLEARPWPLPTLRDFEIVLHENELIAWTLVFGRKVNHFTLATHLIGDFRSLEEFNQYAGQNLGFDFNCVGGIIKGSKEERLKQSSSLHFKEHVQLHDGQVELPGSFIEFVWRYPRDLNKAPTQWTSYFNGFISKNANNVVESLIEASPKFGA